MRKIILIILSIISLTIAAQKHQYFVELDAVQSTGEHAPFWFQNNQYGKIADSSSSINILAGLGKEIDQSKKVFDWGYKLSVLNQTSLNGFHNYLQEYYAQGKLWFLDLIVGAKEEINGPQDSELTSGGFLISRNIKPIPQIKAGIFEYTAIPYTGGNLEIRGGLSHGWFNEEPLAKGVLLHHKFIALRAGGGTPFKLSYGFDHVAQWGGVLSGGQEQVVNLTNYKIVFLAGHGGEDATMSDQINVLGNHIVSQHLRLQAELGAFSANAYWQNVNEDGPIRWMWNSLNWRDGLWGLHIENEKLPVFQHFTAEFIQTVDQSGPWHDKDGVVFGGNDSYFTGAYKMGWSYKGRSISDPLVLSPLYNANGYKTIYYNDMKAWHFGLSGKEQGWEYKLMASFGRYYPDKKLPYFDQQFFLLEASRKFPKLLDSKVKLSVGADLGDLLEKNWGVKLSLLKTGFLF